MPLFVVGWLEVLFSGKCKGQACDKAMTGQVCGFRNRLSARAAHHVTVTALPVDDICKGSG